MELTPAERIKLNAAIVNSVKTGQPLSSNLQTLYNRAAQVESVRQTQPRALLNPGFPTRNVTEVFVDPVTKKRDIYKHSGPASSLPTEDFEELYPRVVPLPRTVPWSQQNKNDIEEELVRTPFQREFDFTKDPGSDWVDQDRVSIQDRSQRFLQNYFGGDPGKVVNPSTGRFYGDELKIHDAMHDFANVGNTLRGEELITIAEQAGASPLQSSNIGLENLTQQFLIGSKYSPAEVTDEAMGNLRGSTRMRGPTLIQQRGAKRGSSLYRDANNIGSFLSPPISKEEYGTMVNRGREFYDQVHNNFANYKRFQDPYDTSKASTPQSDPAVRKDIERAFFNNDYGPSRAVTQGIVGGYGKSNSIPYGNYMSLMNAPLVPTVNEGLWNESIKNQLTSLAPSVEAAIKTEQDFYNSPEQEAIRKAPERWEDRLQLLREAGDADRRKMYTGKEQFIEDEDFKGYMQRLKENKPDLAATVNTPEFDRDVRVFNALRESSGDLNLNIPFRTIRDIAEDTIGPRPVLDYDVLRDQQKLTHSFNALDWVGLGKTQDALQGGIDDTRNKITGGITGAGPTKEGRVYLNPANLGANNLNRDRETPLFQRSSSSILFSPSGRTPNDILLQAAAEAKQIEGYNKALPGIKQAIRTGANATTDITGAIPLFDPEFRQAVEKGDVRKAATQVAKEYATGVVAAPIVGAGTGFAQRLAPRAAAAVIPAAATALRVANPVAVVSQLGGSSKINPAADKKASEAQFRKAEAARRRGGKWKFPTPFGNLTIPEFGISEAGGLFFR